MPRSKEKEGEWYWTISDRLDWVDIRYFSRRFKLKARRPEPRLNARLCLSVNRIDGENWIGVSLTMANGLDYPEDAFWTSSFSAENNLEVRLYTDTEETCNLAEQPHREVLKFIKLTNYDELMRSGLTVRVAMSLVMDPSRKVRQLDLEYEPRFATSLTRALSSWRENLNGIDQNANAIIVNSDGEEFPVCRGLLQARSPVFKAMFQDNTAEQITGRVNIPDISGKALDVLIHFIHTGVLKENWKDEDILHEVVYGAHKYELGELVEYLDNILGLVCTENNCGLLLMMAVRHGLENAGRQLNKRFKKNIAKMEPRELTKFLGEVARECDKRKNEEDGDAENGSEAKKMKM